MRGRSSQGGFTLLEVLVATFIMAVAVTGLLSCLTTSMRNASRLTDYDRAASLAQHKMDELVVDTRTPRGVKLEGKYDPGVTGGYEAGWQALVTTFEAPPQVIPGEMALDRIQLEVWWMEGGQRKSFPLETFRSRMITPLDVTNGTAVAP